MDLAKKLEELEARLRLSEDIEEIKKLKARYAYSVDAHDFDALMDCFAKECSADYGAAGKCGNRDEIERFLRETLPAVAPFIIHMVGNPVIEIDGERATGKWYVNAPLTYGETNEAVWMAGRYDDVYIKEEGKWKFRELVFTLFYMTPFDKGWVKQKTLDA